MRRRALSLRVAWTLLAIFAALAVAGYAAWVALSRVGRMQVHVEHFVYGSSRALTTEGFNYHPHFSSDSRRIVFAHRDSAGEKNAALQVVELDATVTGAPTHEIHHADDVLTNPQWILDDGQIAFLRNFGAPENEIWTIDAAGGNPRRLLASFGLIEEIKASPDGQKLLILTQGRTKKLLVSIAADGTAPPQPVYSFPDHREIPDGYCWSNDSSSVIYVTRRGEAVLVDLQGRELSRRPLPGRFAVREVFADPGDPEKVLVFGSSLSDGANRIGVFSLVDGTLRLYPKRRGRLENGHHLSSDRGFLAYSG